MNVRRRAAALVLCLGAALLVPPAARPGDAPPAASPAGKIAVGYVDINRVNNEAKPIAELNAGFRGTRDNQQKQLADLFAGRLLDDKERQELEGLQKNASRNAAQNARVDELGKISTAREEELKRLMRLEKPTDTERARLTQLSNWLDRQNQRAAQLREEFDRVAQTSVNEINRQATEMVLSVIKAVAEERGIEMVIDQRFVLYGRDDRNLTDVVLQRLNSGNYPKPSSKAPTPPK